MTEYVIWGISPNDTEEKLLVSTIEGKEITDKTTAQNLVTLLTNKYKCREVRIQEINLQKIDVKQTFINTIK